jgi:23S rRNA (uridine2552-2'-O)-methyltransferase
VCLSYRGKAVRLKTAKGRKVSSTKWLNRQLNDPYVALSKKDGYISRAAYKLLEIDSQFHILRKDKAIVDLGASPGSWTQVLSKAKVGKVVAVDLKPLNINEPIEFILGDFQNEEIQAKVLSTLAGAKVDVVLSDMAPNITGCRVSDHAAILSLCESVLEFSKLVLVKGGSMVVKVMHGGGEKQLFDEIKKYFAQVKFFKPIASRKDSIEIYIVALDFV